MTQFSLGYHDYPLSPRRTRRWLMISAIVAVGACVGSYAFATPWTVDDGKGGWIDNPSCSSQTCHDTGVPDAPVKPPAVVSPPPAETPKAPAVTPTKPPVDTPVKPSPDTKGSDRDPIKPLANSPAYGFCCAVDGVNRYHTAFGRDDATAKRDCAARVARLGKLPKCDPWIADAVRGLE